MACSVVRSPLLRNSTVRHYAAAAAAQASVASSPEVEKLTNNVVIAAALPDHPISQISVVFRAGPRNEKYDTQGICHHLRIAAGLTTKGSSYFGITRNIQQLGGTITATVDRETIAYTLLVTRNNLDEALPFLADVASRQEFKPWELSDQIPRLRYELSTIPETIRLLELLHKAAYRNGLGYSLYSPKRQLGKISSETLQHFVNTYFVSSRCAVVSTGVNKQTLANFVAGLELGSGDGKAEDTPAKFCGDEIRKDRNSELASVAVAVETGGLKNDKDALALAVLQRAAGAGPRVKWGSSPAPLYSKVAAAAGSTPFAVSSLNASYSDSGLFGFVLSAPASAAGSLTKAAYEWLKNPKISDNDVSRGKAALKTEVLCSVEHTPSLVDDLGQQALIRGKVSSPNSIVAEIEKLSASDVQSVASKLAGQNVAMAAIGDLGDVPFKNQLN